MDLEGRISLLRSQAFAAASIVIARDFRPRDREELGISKYDGITSHPMMRVDPASRRILDIWG